MNWKPTSEIRFAIVNRKERDPYSGQIFHRPEKVLQQKWVAYEDEMSKMEVACEWRDVPTVVEEK